MEELLRKRDVLNYLKNRKKHYEKCVEIASKRNASAMSLCEEDVKIVDEIISYFENAKAIRFPTREDKKTGGMKDEQVPGNR